MVTYTSSIHLVFPYRWCGPCKQLAPMLDSVVDMKDGAVELAKVDIDNNAELAMEYGVCYHYVFTINNIY